VQLYDGDAGIGVDISKIAEVSGMAEGTIRVSYEDMYPYAVRMLPEKYIGTPVGVSQSRRAVRCPWSNALLVTYVDRDVRTQLLRTS